MDLVFDIETDDVDATKIWCIVAYDLHSDKTYLFDPDHLEDGAAFLAKADKLIGHNIVCFDIPVVKKFLGVDLTENCTIMDTLVLSRLFNPTREGGHSLASWGFRLGHLKTDFKKFDEFTSEMMAYCVNDVILNAKVYKSLKLESKGFSVQSVELEHKIIKLVDDQRQHGFMLDMKKTKLLEAELEERLANVIKEVRKEFKPKAEIFTLRICYNANGEVSKFAKCRELKKRVRLDDDEYEQIKKCNKIKRVIRTDFNLGSRPQIAQYLQDFGWKPKKFTATGQPVVDESTLSKIKNIPQATLIAEYLMIQKRIGLVKSWLKEVDERDSRVHGYVNHNGAVTSRMTHKSPNTAQIPSTNSNYGKECRSCWTVAKGNKLVGIDASGLELRMLAHYMNDGEYTNEIVNGDIHTHNQKIAGLESRSQAKTFIYALLYSAGDPRLGTVVGGGRDAGARLRKLFFDNLPAFKTLKDRVGRASKKGYIKALDGRKLIVRSQHSALNTLLQGAGALVMKKALILFSEYIKDLDAQCVANVHDEWQVESKAEHAEEVGKLGVQAIIDAGTAFNLNCPLDGEYKIGDNWYETH